MTAAPELDGHEVNNALTALRLQAEITAEAVGAEVIAPILRLLDRVEAAVDALLSDGPTVAP